MLDKNTFEFLSNILNNMGINFSDIDQERIIAHDLPVDEAENVLTFLKKYTKGMGIVATYFEKTLTIS